MSYIGHNSFQLQLADVTCVTGYRSIVSSNDDRETDEAPGLLLGIMRQMLQRLRVVLSPFSRAPARKHSVNFFGTS